MKNKTHSLNTNGNSIGKYTKKDYTKELYSLLYKKPLSRRMVATELGFTIHNFIFFLRRIYKQNVIRNKFYRNLELI